MAQRSAAMRTCKRYRHVCWTVDTCRFGEDEKEWEPCGGGGVERGKTCIACSSRRGGIGCKITLGQNMPAHHVVSVGMCMTSSPFPGHWRAMRAPHVMRRMPARGDRAASGAGVCQAPALSSCPRMVGHEAAPPPLPPRCPAGRRVPTASRPYQHWAQMWPPGEPLASYAGRGPGCQAPTGWGRTDARRAFLESERGQAAVQAAPCPQTKP